MTQLTIERPVGARQTVRSRLVIYFTLAFALSWAFWLLAAALKLSIHTPAGRLLEIAGNFGPFLAALVGVSATQGRPGLRRLGQRLIAWRVPAGVYLVALLLPFLLMGAALAVSLALGGAVVEYQGLGFLLGLVPLFLRSLLISGGLNEETGWRGAALPGLLERSGPMRASLLLGVLWGLWHAPLYFLPGTNQYELVQSGGSFVFFFGAFIVWTAGLSILFTWLYNWAGGSVWIMMLFHAAVNTASGLPFFLGIQAPMSALLYPAFTWVAALIVARGMQGQSSLEVIHG